MLKYSFYFLSFILLWKHWLSMFWCIIDVLMFVDSCIRSTVARTDGTSTAGAAERRQRRKGGPRLGTPPLRPPRPPPRPWFGVRRCPHRPTRPEVIHIPHLTFDSIRGRWSWRWSMISAPSIEPAMPRRKKYPGLAYKTNEIFEAAAAGLPSAMTNTGVSAFGGAHTLDRARVTMYLNYIIRTLLLYDDSRFRFVAYQNLLWLDVFAPQSLLWVYHMDWKVTETIAWNGIR